MAPPDLQPGSLYVVLFNRNDPPIANDYHWALYLHESPMTGGIKYHIKTVGQGWIPDHGSTADIMKQFLLVGLFRIPDVPEELLPHLDRTLRSQDANLNYPAQTCRRWLLRMLYQLREPVNGKIILQCAYLSALQNEIFNWGNSHAISAAVNEQPRPIGASTFCGLSHCTMDITSS